MIGAGIGAGYTLFLAAAQPWLANRQRLSATKIELRLHAPTIMGLIFAVAHFLRAALGDHSQIEVARQTLLLAAGSFMATAGAQAVCRLRGHRNRPPPTPL